MFNLIITALYDIITSLSFESWIYFMSIIVCIMLLGSPGAIGTILGAGTKLGIFNFLKEEHENKA